jgi:hypothetical protein
MRLRLSNVTTGAEWIQTRFGKGAGSSLSRGDVMNVTFSCG